MTFADYVIRHICDAHGLTVDRLKGRERVTAVAWPRQDAMALLAADGQLSLATIGRVLGGRDHSTVVQARRAVARRDPDRDVAAEAARLRAAWLDAEVAAGRFTRSGTPIVPARPESPGAIPVVDAMCERGCGNPMHVPEYVRAEARDSLGRCLACIRADSAERAARERHVAQTLATRPAYVPSEAFLAFRRKRPQAEVVAWA